MKPVDPKAFATDRILKNLQGNTIKGHGREHTTHIFIHFNANCIPAVKEWVRSFAEDNLTSSKKQLEEREAFKKEDKPGGLFSALFLSAAGYKALGFTDVQTKFSDPAFKAGLKARRTQTNDPTTNKWEEGYRHESHAMILLADDDPKRMGNFTKVLLDVLDKFSRIDVVEYGDAIRNSALAGIEHFGYVDGTSQPLFLKDEIESYEQLHGVTLSPPSPNLKFDPSADTNLILIPDPYVTPHPEKPSFGSYFVFRKLEQNVRAFKEAEEKVGKKLFPNLGDESKRELAGAYLVGRFEDGSPVLMDDEDSILNSASFNNFDYSNDPSGGRCPHFAHIRKANPRRDAFDKSKTMARRGIPFGHRNVDTELDPIAKQTPESGVGLLFMSYQASIETQFEFIQQSWANSAGFPTGGTGIDPIIGQSAAGAPSSERTYKLPQAYGTPVPGVEATFDQFVTMKGGEYFFAPSITFLKSLV
ncbi:Dyp-type peroxidase [Spirosoma pollinicola]|uniref:Peroxidase n=1 Tax=Spirosoma pollinicola TaxID=2057025 RepID=A0A2K8Z802_9BACT|nr:Dyp-type peroxidase [Spirosoma pollinicola]AUD05974.1 peroxidase [Spirosoma pollinicola]